MRRLRLILTSPSPKLLWLLLAPGFGLIYLGWRGDEAGTWNKYGFLGNVVSGVATTLLGVPFAFFFLQALLRRNQEDREYRRAVRLVGHNLSEINSALNPYSNQANIKIMIEKIDNYCKYLTRFIYFQESFPAEISDKFCQDGERVRAYAFGSLNYLPGEPPTWVTISRCWSEINTTLPEVWPRQILAPDLRQEIEEAVRGEDPMTEMQAANVKFERIDDLLRRATNGSLGSNSRAAPRDELSLFLQILRNLKRIDKTVDVSTRGLNSLSLSVRGTS